jgi:flavin-dependent dehydrogenase
VVGDGPAGTSLAQRLAQRGHRVALFARGRPPLVAGESLVPAVIPLLRELGVEDEVRRYAVHKPGATFVVAEGDALSIHFEEACSRVPGYAYNVPRDRLDATLRSACARAGVQVIEAAARMTRDPARSDRVRLADASRADAVAALGAEPDLIVDATGRARALARLLELPTRVGARRDSALFAHCRGVPLDQPGHVHTDRLSRGWCWRIPLGDRVSVGIVADASFLRRFGAGLEAQFDGYTRSEPYLKRITEHAERITPVVKYTNYQSTTLRGVGDGWALVGDSFGFVDPVFSSGLYLALAGARALARAIDSGSAAALRRYERFHLRHLSAWQRAASYYYDGRFFALLRLRDAPAARGATRLLHRHFAAHAPRIFTGEGITNRYSGWLLHLVAERALRRPEYREPHIL